MGNNTNMSHDENEVPVKMYEIYQYYTTKKMGK